MATLTANDKVYNIHPHAQRNMRRRGITVSMVIEVMEAVEPWHQDITDRDVYEQSVQNARGRWTRIRVIVEEDSLLIVTAMIVE